MCLYCDDARAAWERFMQPAELLLIDLDPAQALWRLG
jgi:hypothetical protein